MKQIPLLLLPILLFACSTKNKRNDILTTGNLQSQFFYVNPDRDTVLKTAHAATLRIRKGTFPGAGQVSIEIKEAYRPDEILMAGLTTTSGDDPLRSAGMIYFNATADGKTVEPAIPVKASIPANEKDNAMQIFKGEEKADGSIDWVNPQPVDTAWPEQKRKMFEAGKQLFQGKCASCHKIFKPITGPGLRNLQYRGPWKNIRNLLAFINNPAGFMSKDPYTQKLKSQYGGQMMTAFMDIKLNDVEAMLVYLNNSDSEVNPPSPGTKPVAAPDTMSYTEPDCGYDTIYVPEVETYSEYDTTSYPEIIPMEMDTTNTSFDDSTMADTFSYSDYYKQKYEINIEANGWYNVDALIKPGDKLDGKVKLNAILNQPAAFDMDVYVVLPTEKIMQLSSGHNQNNYRFILWNGKIPLPIGYRAFIFAVGSYKDKIYYGITDFTITAEQTIPVDIKETTKDKLKNLIYSKRMDGVEINAVEKVMKLEKIPCHDFPQKDTAGAEQQ